MREIKFRAWNKEEGIRLSYLDEHGFYFYLPGVGTKEYINSAMQYTGLKDKNGKEIYEGDIVEIEDGPNKKNREVIFRDGAFSLRVGNGSVEYLPNYVHYKQIEIIGNLYENPELIKLKKTVWKLEWLVVTVILDGDGGKYLADGQTQIKNAQNVDVIH